MSTPSCLTLDSCKAWDCVPLSVGIWVNERVPRSTTAVLPTKFTTMSCTFDLTSESLALSELSTHTAPPRRATLNLKDTFCANSLPPPWTNTAPPHSTDVDPPCRSSIDESSSEPPAAILKS